MAALTPAALRAAALKTSAKEMTGFAQAHEKVTKDQNVSTEEKDVRARGPSSQRSATHACTNTQSKHLTMLIAKKEKHIEGCHVHLAFLRDAGLQNGVEYNAVSVGLEDLEESVAEHKSELEEVNAKLGASKHFPNPLL